MEISGNTRQLRLRFSRADTLWTADPGERVGNIENRQSVVRIHPLLGERAGERASNPFSPAIRYPLTLDN